MFKMNNAFKTIAKMGWNADLFLGYKKDFSESMEKITYFCSA